MSVRESIAENIVTTIGDIISPVDIKYVTREPFQFDKLSNAQYPAVLVRTADENREDSTIGGSIGKRMATINYELVCFVKGALIDQARKTSLRQSKRVLMSIELEGALQKIRKSPKSK